MEEKNLHKGSYICQVCQNEKNNQVYLVKEMMFGLGEQFSYCKCSRCGCLQLINKPRDMDRYYPKDYYSFNGRGIAGVNGQTLSAMGSLLFTAGRFRLFRKPIHMAGKCFLGEYFAEALMQLAGLGIKKNARVLDVGCGKGLWLSALRGLGFTDLTGIDLFIEKEVSSRGISIWKKDLLSLDEAVKYDIIALHHSFEHMDNPGAVLGKIFRLLSSNGVCILRIPVADCRAWEEYGTDWFQIDAPRHFFLHTRRSIAYLCRRNGLKVVETMCDSNINQFAISEWYKQGISMNRGQRHGKHRDIPKKKRRRLLRKTHKLNREGLGDQRIFYLMRADRCGVDK